MEIGGTNTPPRVPASRFASQQAAHWSGGGCVVLCRGAPTLHRGIYARHKLASINGPYSQERVGTLEITGDAAIPREQK